MEEKRLAACRVAGMGNIRYMELSMNTEERNIRRAYMRRILKNTVFSNVSNDKMDGMRILKAPSQGGCIVEDENGYEFYIPEVKVSAGEAKFRKARAMMPFEFMDLSGNDFEWNWYGKAGENAKNTVNKYILNYETFKNKGIGLYIYSKAKGSGKTMLSCCILNELAKRYIGSVKFVNTLDFLEMTKKGFNYDNQDVESLYTCSALVLDDIGVQLDKEWTNTVFYRLINDRYNNQKVTIYTSNMAIADLKMDDRIIDRIEVTSLEIHIPEVPVRSKVRSKEKDKILEEIRNKENSPIGSGNSPQGSIAGAMR